VLVLSVFFSDYFSLIDDKGSSENESTHVAGSDLVELIASLQLFALAVRHVCFQLSLIRSKYCIDGICYIAQWRITTSAYFTIASFSYNSCFHCLLHGDNLKIVSQCSLQRRRHRHKLCSV